MANEYYSFGKDDVNLQRQKILNKIFNPTSKALLKKAGIKPGIKILDLACGYGTLSCWLAKKVGPNGFVTSIDTNAERIAFSQRLAKQKNIQNIEFKVMSAYDLAALQDSFDLLYHRFLLVHLTNPRAALKAMYACLKHNGKLVSETSIYSHCFSDPVCESYDAFIKYVKQLFASQGKEYDVGKFLYQFLTETGFQEIKHNFHTILLKNAYEKSLVYLGLESIAELLLQAGLLNQQEINELYISLKNDAGKKGYWVTPTLCQSIAIK